MKKIKYEMGVWDWKEEPYKDLFKILKKLDVHMYPLSSFDGTDTYGFIFTKEKLTRKQVNQIDEKELPRK